VTEDNDIKWGPSGLVVFNRTYSRTKTNGEKETWPETVERVVDGNLALGNRPDLLWSTERDDLIKLITEFKIVPAGRQLWMSGVPGRQFLFNCHVAGWTDQIEDHFSFTFLRLMEGGGVGANYSTRNMGTYGISRSVDVYVVCDPSHPDYAEMEAEGLLTHEFSSDWTGSIEVEDSREGWDEALRDLLRASTGRTRHSKRVYDVSRVRWKGARIKSFGGTASGPLPLAKMLLNVGAVLNRRFGVDVAPYAQQNLSPLDAMEIDHEIAQCVVSGGNRRSARMSILHWNDPWIRDFLACKEDPEKHWTTNVSVEIDSKFIDYLKPNSHPESEGDIEDWKNAQEVYRLIVEGMLKNGEPGIWNSSLSNADEPGYVEATNPCGEITLQAWENCNLGHVNLDAFAPSTSAGGYAVWQMTDALHYAHRLMARFLIRATYGDIRDDKQRGVVLRNRRIGVGHFGFAGYVAKSGIKFSDSWKGDLRGILGSLQNSVAQAAQEYAYQLRIPVPVKTTTVAPTGTIAKMPGRTEGIHPPYAKYFIRRIRFSTIVEQERQQLEALEMQGFFSEKDQYSRDTWVVSIPTMETLIDEVNALGLDGDSIVQSVDEISLKDMLEVQAMYQEYYANNAVSFTVNVQHGQYTTEEVMETLLPFLPRLKGTTIFPDFSRPQAPYERISKEEYGSHVARALDSSVDDECASGACPVR
jgi:adenosylcobalamin-dependent ribonucleoside-triphosphate reductase